MKTFGFIFTIACLISINVNETFEYAIDRHDDSNNSRSLSSVTQVEKGQMNDANKPAALPVDENPKIDGINEVDLKSIIHPGHKVKRCESMTPLRKPRFTSPVKMVNNEKNEAQFQNPLNKNEVTVTSSKLNNNETELRIIEADAEDENASSKKSSSFPIAKTLHQIDERPEISIEEGDIALNEDEVDLQNDKVKRHDEKKKKKYVCYCVEDGCTKNHVRPHQKSNKNQLSSQILRSGDLYSQLSALEREDSLENYEEDQEESLLGSKSNGGKKRPGNKRPKNKKCKPVVIPCSIAEDESPTKIKIPVNGESNQPSTINPYHVPNNYQSYQTVPNVPNYYGSPYLVYHPVHAVNLPSQQRSMEDDRLGGVHGLYDAAYMEPEERSRLEECIQLYGADYCLSGQNFNDYTNSYHPDDPTYGGIHGNYHGEHGLIDSSNEFIDTPEDSTIYSKYYHQGNGYDDDDDDYQDGSDREMPGNKGQRLLGHRQMNQPMIEPLEGSRHFPENGMTPESTEMDDMMDDDDDHFERDRLTKPVDDFPIYDESTESDESQQLGITPIIGNSRYRPINHGTTVSDEDFDPTNEPMYPPRTGIRDETEIDGFTDSNYYSDEFEDDIDTQVESGRKGPGHHPTIEPMTEDHVDIFGPIEGPTHLPELGMNPQTNKMDNDDDEDDDDHDDNDNRNGDRYSGSVDDLPIEETSTESSKFQHLGRPMNSNRQKPIIVQPGFAHHNPNVPSQTPESGDRSTSIPDLFQNQFQPNNGNEDDDEDDDTINQGMSNPSPPNDDYSDENVSSDYEDYVQNSSEEPSVASPPEVHEPNSHKYVHNPNYSTTESSRTEPSLGHQPDAIRIGAAPQDYTGSTENIDNYNNYDDQYESGPHDETSEQSNEYESTHENPQEARQPDAPEEYQPSSEFAAAPQKLQTTTEDARHSPELVCPNPETVSASAEKHLEDLQALTGLSLKDSLLLRGTIYKAINQLASNTREHSRITSPCDVISAPEPSQIEGLAEVPVLNNIFNVPEVRSLILNTVRSLIPQVTSVSRKSSLGKLTDNAIDSAISIVLGDDVPIDSEEPELGISNDNAPGPDIIMRIIKSIINRPGIGLYGARFPEIQNIIVQTVENIVNRAKNVVDNSVIWDALNDVLDRSKRPEHHTSPVIPRPPAYGNKPLPRPSVHGTKPLPHISVIEHSKKNGQWQEESATVGYHDEYSKARNPAILAASRDEPEETVTNETEESVMNPPITYHSPGNIKVKYIKDHSKEPSNLGSVNSGSNEEESISEEQYSDNKDDDNLGAIRIPSLGHSHQVSTESYTKSSTKATKKHYSANKKNKAVQQFSKFDGEPLEAARVFPENGEVPDPNPSAFLGKITSDSDLSSINNVEDLVSANLYYVGDGAKLPLTVTRMSDGSFALSISNKVCEHFVKENCPCCAAKLENVRISSSSGDEGIRMRQTRRRGHSRQIRATTANENEAISTIEDMPTVTEMPADKFAEKYNLTLSFGDKNEIKSFDGKKGWQKKIVNSSSNDLIQSRSAGESVNDPEEFKVVLQLSDESEIMNDIQKNQYIQDLLSIHDVPEQNRAELVINALDGLLNSSPNTRIHDNGSNGNNINGFEYQVDNPIMERMKYINEKEIKRGKYKYQQNIDEAAEERMETAKNILHWLKELIVKSKGNNIS